MNRLFVSCLLLKISHLIYKKYKRKQNNVLVIGDIFLDVLVNLEKENIEEIYGKDIVAKNIGLYVGGSATNTAIHLASLLENTGQVDLISSLASDDIGMYLKNRLKQYNVNYLGIIPQNESSSSTCIVLSGPVDRGFITNYGSLDTSLTVENIELQLQQDLIQFIAKKKYNHIHIGGFFGLKSLQLNKILCAIDKTETTVSLDTNYDASEQWLLNKELTKHIDYTIVNEIEATNIANTKNISEALIHFKEKLLVKYPVITLGEQGAIGLFNNKEITVKPQRTKVVDSVGSGDAFNAGFIYTLLKQLPFDLNFETMLQNGCKCGSLNIQRIGASESPILLQEFQS